MGYSLSPANTLETIPRVVQAPFFSFVLRVKHGRSLCRFPSPVCCLSPDCYAVVPASLVVQHTFSSNLATRIDWLLLFAA